MTPTPRTSARPRRHTRTAALLVAAAALAAPAAACADSIVYVHGGNVWSASPDGSGKVQLTDGGGWHSPTQADDGTIAAVQGTGPIVVMARDGRPLHTIATPSAKSGDGGTFAPRPVQLSFSPDGTKIAYAYLASSCPVASSCGTVQRSTFYTRADVEQATPVEVWGNQFGVSNPEWVTNARTLVFGGHGSQVSIDDLGPGDYSQVPWMTPEADMGDGEVSRDGRRLVTTFDYGARTILAFFAVSGDVRTETPPAMPAIACSSSEPDAKLADPSWSPDGSAVAFESSSGIETLRFTRFGANDCATTGPSTGLASTGSSPDWGPADPPAARWTPPVDRPTRSTPREERPAPPSVRRGDRPQDAGSASVGQVSIVGPRSATRAALRRGLPVTVTLARPGTVAVTLRAGGRAIARGSMRARRAGRVTVRLSKVSANALAKARGKRLHLAVRATATGKPPVTATHTLALR